MFVSNLKSEMAKLVTTLKSGEIEDILKASFGVGDFGDFTNFVEKITYHLEDSKNKDLPLVIFSSTLVVGFNMMIDLSKKSNLSIDPVENLKLMRESDTDFTYYSSLMRELVSHIKDSIDDQDVSLAMISDKVLELAEILDLIRSCSDDELVELNERQQRISAEVGAQLGADIARIL